MTSADARSRSRITPGTRFYDLWHGEELKPEVQGDRALLSFEIEAHGFGAVLARTRSAERDRRTTLLSRDA